MLSVYIHDVHHFLHPRMLLQQDLFGLWHLWHWHHGHHWRHLTGDHDLEAASKLLQVG